MFSKRCLRDRNVRKICDRDSQNCNDRGKQWFWWFYVYFQAHIQLSWQSFGEIPQTIFGKFNQSIQMSEHVQEWFKLSQKQEFCKIRNHFFLLCEIYRSICKKYFKSSEDHQRGWMYQKWSKNRHFSIHPIRHSSYRLTTSNRRLLHYLSGVQHTSISPWFSLNSSSGCSNYPKL